MPNGHLYARSTEWDIAGKRMRDACYDYWHNNNKISKDDIFHNAILAELTLPLLSFGRAVSENHDERDQGQCVFGRSFGLPIL